MHYKSLRGYIWEMYSVDIELITELVQRLNISEVTARILINRGICNFNDAMLFLNPRLNNILPNPFSLLDMDKAVKRIVYSCVKGEKITIFADYDVDGATAGALMYRFFRSIGKEVEVFIPNRLTDGYGPSIKSFQKLYDQGTRLIITVDCGSVAFEAIDFATKIGLDVIVVDHHITDNVLPKAFAILNPNRYDEKFTYKAIAAVSVVFLLIIALRVELRQINWFKDIAEPDLNQFLDLVALGTVCDLMPLHLLNRTFVKKGLSMIMNNSNPGIKALIDMTRININKLSSHHLGFTIGPRINAGGRVNDSYLGFKLLSTNSYEEASKIASFLEILNSERKTLELQVLNEAIESVNKTHLNKNAIIAIGQGWHIGVLGIVANRIREHYHKPAFIISINDNEQLCKGSIRSVPGLDVANLLSEAKNLQLLSDGGGHAMAGGFSIHYNNIEKFSQFIYDYVNNNIHHNAELLNNAKKIYIDAMISINGINTNLMNAISMLEPFGMQNPKPRFMLQNIMINNIIEKRQGFLIMDLYDAFSPQYTIKGLMFYTPNNDTLQILQSGSANKKLFNIIGTIQYNNFNQDINFSIEDIQI